MSLHTVLLLLLLISIMEIISEKAVMLLFLLTVDGQQWYTASFSEGFHQSARIDPKLDELTTNLKLESIETDTATRTNNIVTESNTSYKNENQNETPKTPLLTGETDNIPNHSANAFVKGVILHKNTITNINVVKRIKPKRRIVRKCPSMWLSKKKHNPKARFLDVFQVVQFDHVPCVSSSGLEGVCLPEHECQESAGLPMGSCADGYATCCVTQLSCGDQSRAKIGWYTNPGYPLPSNERLSCVVTIDKFSPDIQQIRLDLVNFELLPPNYGACEQDQFVVSGQNINSAIPILCGVNNGHHMYVEVGDVEGPLSLSVQTVSADDRLFAIKITQLTVADSLAVPSGCLQYYKDTQGYLESFNYQEKSSLAITKLPGYLNNLNYAMCIERAPGTCSVTYTNTGEMEIINYEDDLPIIPPGQAGVEIFNCPNDWLLIAATRLCGERINDGSVLQDFSLDAPVTDIASGPITVWFRSDSAYVGRGFRLKYEQNSCTNTV